VYDFWLSPDISHPTGNKSDIKRERLGPNIYPLHMTQVLEKTQTEAYIDFVAKYPDIKFGPNSGRLLTSGSPLPVTSGDATSRHFQ
jgi:hypothetical protein